MGGREVTEGMEARRERSLEVLTRAFSSDRISMEEYERRVGAAQVARDRSELAAIIADLPDEAPGGNPPAAAPSRPNAVGGFPARPVDPGLAGSQTLACVMGERHLTGDWLNGDRVDSFTFMGSTKIDLRDVSMPPERLKITVVAVMGETRVVVPRGLPVRMNVFPFMGEATAKRDVDQRVVPGEPYVLIEGFVMMGSLVVVAQD